MLFNMIKNKKEKPNDEVVSSTTQEIPKLRIQFDYLSRYFDMTGYDCIGTTFPKGLIHANRLYFDSCSTLNKTEYKITVTTVINILSGDKIKKDNILIYLNEDYNKKIYELSIINKKDILTMMVSVVYSITYIGRNTFEIKHCFNLPESARCSKCVSPITIFDEKFKRKFYLIDSGNDFRKYLHSKLNAYDYSIMKVINHVNTLDIDPYLKSELVSLVSIDYKRYSTLIEYTNKLKDNTDMAYLLISKFKNEKDDIKTWKI